MPVSLGQTTQTVVLTTASQQGQGSVLSLPIGIITKHSEYYKTWKKEFYVKIYI